MSTATETTYRIHAAATGLHLGDFTGETEEQALDAYARDAGYDDFADLLDRVPDSSRDDVRVIAKAPPPIVRNGRWSKPQD